MGVIHKLKQEVVDYILTQKQSSPALSCRKLADLASKEFDQTISKSSVSGVLKGANLSSPVGRRGQKEKSAKPKRRTLATKTLRVGASETAPSGDRSPEGISQTVSAEGIRAKGMGFIFIKAAEWELAGGSLLGQLLEGFVPGEKARCSFLGESLLYKEVFSLPGYGIPSELIPLLSADPQATIPVIQDALAMLIDVNLEELTLKLNFELDNYQKKIRFIRLEREGGVPFLLDAEMSSVWTKNSNLPFWGTIVQTLNVISRQIINNVQSAAMCFCPITGQGLNQDLSLLADIIQTFENKQNKKINKLILIDENDEEVTSFDTIPQKRRNLSVALWSWQPGFSGLVQKIRPSKVEHLFVASLKKEIYFSEAFMTLQPGDQFSSPCGVRVILLRSGRIAAPFAAVLSNALYDEKGAREILLEYVQRWPNLWEGFNYFVGKHLTLEAENPAEHHIYSKEYIMRAIYKNTAPNYSINNSGENSYEIGATSHFAANLLYQHCFSTYFAHRSQSEGIHEYLESFVRLSGYYRLHPQKIEVGLIPPHDEIFRKDLELAIQRVNERLIVDPQGRRLFLELGE